MADIINLRRARKQKTRTEKQQQAAQNRQHHGRSKAEKIQDTAREERNRMQNDIAVHRLDQAKISPNTDTDTGTK